MTACTDGPRANALVLRERVTVVVVRTGRMSTDGARASVLHAAAGVLGSTRPLRLEHAPGGRPLLRGLGPGVEVSLSHGRGFAALAVGGTGPLGVDLEVVRPLPADRLAARWFTAAEAAWVGRRRASERSTAYFWVWTQKEAAGKALGIGLRSDTLRAPVPLPDHWPPRPGGDLVLTAADGLRRAAALPVPGLVLALAVSGTPTGSAAVDLRLRI